MTQTNSHWRLDRPSEGFYSAEVASESSAALTVRAFLPDGYEPRYPYPVVVLLHGQGSDDAQVLELAPALSRRNFIAVSFRVPDEALAPPPMSFEEALVSELTTSRTLTDTVLKAVDQVRRAYHIHTERVYLVGVCEGAMAAYRAAFALNGKIAGVATLNGSLPKADGQPLFTLPQVRGLRVMIAHNKGNATAPHPAAMRDYRIFYGAGADVSLQSYAGVQSVHPNMLRDLNRWIIGHVTKEQDQLRRKARKKK